MSLSLPTCPLQCKTDRVGHIAPRLSSPSAVEHMFETTSGNFNTPLLKFHMETIGLSRIMFSIDYPFVSIPEGAEWFAGPISLRLLQGRPDARILQGALFGAQGSHSAFRYGGHWLMTMSLKYLSHVTHRPAVN